MRTKLPGDPLYRFYADFTSEEERLNLLDLIKVLPEESWELGRQQTGYLKRRVNLMAEYVSLPAQTVFQRCLRELHCTDERRTDCYFLRFPKGVGIPSHVDPSPEDGWAHLRLNVILQPAVGFGGTFFLNGRKIDLMRGDAIMFRPDLYLHQITPVGGPDELIALSVGFLSIADTL